MKSLITTTAASLLFVISSHATTIFSHTFDGGTDDLNATTVDEGSGTWVAPALFDQNGDFNVTDRTPFGNDLDGRGLATVGVTISSGFIYTLEASLGGFTGGSDWLAFGFANATNVITALDIVTQLEEGLGRSSEAVEGVGINLFWPEL